MVSKFEWPVEWPGTQIRKTVCGVVLPWSALVCVKKVCLVLRGSHKLCGVVLTRLAWYGLVCATQVCAVCAVLRTSAN